jgi:hypothetical protein
MTRLTHAWRALGADQRLAGAASVALLVTMLLPWYGLQSLDRKTGQLYSHSISAFGDVSFVEAAIFLVAAGVLVLVLARGEGREFRLPGGDGTIVALAGGWAAVLIFYRVFSRPAGGGYPVGIEWGFFLAFVAAGTISFAGWRMRASARPDAPLRRERSRHERETAPGGRAVTPSPPREPIVRRAKRPAPVAARERDRNPPAPQPTQGETVAARTRPRRPPAPRRDEAGEQLSFEDPTTRVQ